MEQQLQLDPVRQFLDFSGLSSESHCSATHTKVHNLVNFKLLSFGTLCIAVFKDLFNLFIRLAANPSSPLPTCVTPRSALALTRPAPAEPSQMCSLQP